MDKRVADMAEQIENLTSELNTMKSDFEDHKADTDSKFKEINQTVHSQADSVKREVQELKLLLQNRSKLKRI